MWASGAAYERYVGRWSRLVAPTFVEWLAVPGGLRWLDVGCGTGALSGAVLAGADPAEVVGVDPSDAHVSAAAAAFAGDPRVHFAVGDSDHLPAVTVDVVVSGLVLNFVPDAAAAVAAMRDRAPAGVVAAYVWDYAGRMELMRYFWDAAVALDPAAARHDEGARFTLCRPERLEVLWGAAGLGGVEVRAIEIPTVFRDFGDYWTPFLGGQGPAPAYVMSLDEDRREGLRQRLRAALPTAGDGSISLVARAWAVRGEAQ